MRNARRLSGCILLAFLASCLGPKTLGDDDRRAIESLLRAYAEALPQAYASGSIEDLSKLATEREQNRVRKAIADLAVEGKVLQPRLQRLTIESIESSGAASATATTIEVWDLEVRAAGSDEQISAATGQENRLTYSLIHERGEWRVLARILRSSSESP